VERAVFLQSSEGEFACQAVCDRQKQGVQQSHMRKIIQLAGCLPLFVASLAAAQGPDDAEIERHGIHSHAAIEDPYRLQVSVLRSGMLPPAVASEHGVDAAPDRGILNVMVTKAQGGKQVTVPADVTAVAINLRGRTDPIEMRQVIENEHITYLGSFPYQPPGNLRFVVNALPQGSSRPLGIEFEDSLEVPG
jgi:hypothetical protein